MRLSKSATEQLDVRQLRVLAAALQNLERRGGCDGTSVRAIR